MAGGGLGYNIDMINSDTIKALKFRYINIHPLIFLRSVERVKTPGELFDMLESFPTKYPVCWSDEKHMWTTTDNIFQEKK